MRRTLLKSIRIVSEEELDDTGNIVARPKGQANFLLKVKKEEGVEDEDEEKEKDNGVIDAEKEAEEIDPIEQ